MWAVTLLLQGLCYQMGGGGGGSTGDRDPEESLQWALCTPPHSPAWGVRISASAGVRAP